jgi:hypothetical protein
VDVAVLHVCVGSAWCLVCMLRASIHALLADVLPRSLLLEMTLENMNSLRLVGDCDIASPSPHSLHPLFFFSFFFAPSFTPPQRPKQDAERGRLMAGLLQLAPGTALVLDETALTAGRLDQTGECTHTREHTHTPTHTHTHTHTHAHAQTHTGARRNAEHAGAAPACGLTDAGVCPSVFLAVVSHGPARFGLF